MKLNSYLVLMMMVLICHQVQSQILLPVEVIGEEGKIVERKLTLTKEMSTVTERLWLQVNNMSYENKASIKINDGDWLNLNHSTVDMQYQEKARGGMAHGGFNTIRFSIPATDFTAGENTIHFRFNMSDAISNGFRVIRLNLLDQQGSKILPDEYFVEEDPNTWRPPYADSQSIEEGKDLWYNGKLWSNYLPEDREGFWYGIKLQPFQPIKATCSSCHTQDGRDLELFAYSNESIIERAKFHNLSQEEGKKIASYIRSLSDKHDNVNRHGRPWNPPYQPGPELEGKQIEYWAAGAGLDAVLDKDADMAEYMFPDGISEESVADRFDSDKMVDRTQLPLAVQLPDWKHWLPMIHPIDAFDRNNFYSDANTAFSPAKAYPAYRKFLEDNSPLSEANANDMMIEIEEFWRNFRFFLSEGADEGRGEHWRADDGFAITQGLIDEQLLEFAATSLGRLLAVKNFEVVQEFDLQDKSHWFVDPIDQPAERQWFGDMYQVFEIPPHFTACVYNDCRQFEGQPNETGEYESTAWYQLQAVVNGGNGMISHNSPVDYNYQQQFIAEASYSSGLYEPLRYYHALNTMYQTRTWSGATTPNNGKGFRIRVQGPWQFFGKEGDAGASQLHGFGPSFWPTLLDKQVHYGMTKWVLDAQIRQFLKEVHKPENDVDFWNRWPSSNEISNVLDPEDKTKVEDVLGPLQGFTSNPEGPYWSDHLYWSIQESIKFGVDCHLIDSMIDWGKKAWPNIVQYEDRVTTKDHLFEELRQTATAGLDLKVIYTDACSPSIEALVSNGGNQPQFDWYVNDELVTFSERVLPASQVSPGDVVKCILTSNEDCIRPGGETAQSEIHIFPDLGVSVSVDIADNPIAMDEEILVNSQDVLNINVSASGIPSDYFEPVLWLDAMDLGAALSDGDEVTSWKDQSSYQNNAQPRETALRPKYDSDGFNGLPAVMFGQSGNADGLELFSSAQDGFMEDDWTIILVGATNTGSDWTNLIGNKNTPAGDGWYYRYSKDNRTQVSAGQTSFNGGTYGNGHQFISVISKVGSSLTLAINGTEGDASVTLPSSEKMTNNESISLGVTGNANSGTNRYHKGPISEVIVFDRNLNANEIEFFESYLASKWKMNGEDLSLIKAKGSPFSIQLINPSGEQMTLEASEDTYQIPLVSSALLGDYTFVKSDCSNEFYSFKLKGNMDLDDYQFEVSENSVNDLSLGNIQATHFEDGSIGYEIVSGGEGAFALVNTTGELKVLDGSKINYEEHPQIAMLISASDGSGGFATAKLTINVKDENDLPELVKSVEDQMLDQGFENREIELSQYITDEDMDELTYALTSSNEQVATVSVSNGKLIITEVGEGETTITVTADDGNGGSVSDNFVVTITDLNDAPTISELIPDQNIDLGFETKEFDLASVFIDVDGDNMTFTASSSAEDIATVTINGNNLVITEIGIGETTITVTADDNKGGSVSFSFVLNIQVEVLSVQQDLTALFSVYPNPSRRLFKIKSELFLYNPEIQVSLVDLLGRRLNFQMINQNDDTMILDLLNNAPGVYMLTVDLDDQHVNFHIVKK
ncbi:MAG: T9SS type A sorting domain-containing protein [Cyclobacteriaceae bacterium]